MKRIELVRHVIENRFKYKRYLGYITYHKLMRYYDKLVEDNRKVKQCDLGC